MGFYKELGDRLEKWLKEKIKVVDTKVESIAKYQKYANTELDSCFCKVTNAYTAVVGEYVPFIKESGSFEVKDGRVVVKPGQRVQINVSFTYEGATTPALVNYYIKDYTNDVIISTVLPYHNQTNLGYEHDFTQFGQYTNDTDKDCEIGLYVSNADVTDTLRPLYTTMTVQEINRQIIIDPLEHVNESHGIEDTPVGHIISHMGTVAPKHYLICDGAEYNIADYPYLAQHIEDNFGSISYFGGDGETTFRVPDLRGEFLRGTGTGVRNTGSGANVGEHQDGTLNTCVAVDSNGNIYFTKQSSDETLVVKDVDKYIYDENKRIDVTAKGTTYTGNTGPYAIITRPTNTSVLYCIKYEPTYFMNTYNTNYIQPSLYSLEEKVVGSWIDGKPLYEKVVKVTMPNKTIGTSTPHGIENLDTLTNFSLNWYDSEDKAWYDRFRMWISSSTNYSISNELNIDSKNINITPNGNNIIDWSSRTTNAFCKLQYTKTTDEENSFTNDMLKDSYVELTYSNEEISTMVSDILGGEE